MKSYPKVLRYNHDSVDDSFFEEDDLVLLEKLDGSNFRIILFDERYSDMYTEEIYEYNPSHKEVFFGTSNLMRGRISEPIDSFDGNFGRVLKYVRNNLDREQLVSMHEEFDSPLLLFGENMVRHTLDYEYDYNPPPAFLGFDIFKMDEHTGDSPSNLSFDERFDGFLDIDSAFDVFDRVGLNTVPLISKDGGGIDISEYEVPISEYRNGQAEGVVFRSDSLNRRVKYRTEEFKERAKTAWGMKESEADNGAQLFVARYITNPRIRKHIHKKETKGERIEINEITNAVVTDAWEEEWNEISEISIPIETDEIYELASERCEAVFQTMKDNARLNNSSIDDLWADTVDSLEDVSSSTFDVDESRVDELVDAVNNHSTVEAGLARTLVPPVPIHDAAEEIADEKERTIGRWVIEPTFERMDSRLWLDNLEYFATFPYEFTPSKVSSELFEYVKEELELRDDVDIDEKPDDWEPNVEESETDGLGNLFD
jgi:hypothetical protein